MNDKDRLQTLCAEGLKTRTLDADIQDRLSDELREIDAQNEFQYFLDLHDKKTKYPKNENNLLVPYLLGIVDDYEHVKPPQYVYGEFPDIDIDYLPTIRDYLKNTWAAKTFGHDKVCNIGSYNSFGIKSALIDMAKVHGKSRSEILDLTTKLGLKDEDGKALTWDKALETYPDLKKYCEENPDVAEASKRLLHRNRGMGMHAGGLIVSSTNLTDLVPLVRGKENTQVSAWVEGLHGQWLGPMGLVKFDLLVITNILQIAKACRLIKQRYGLEHICAKPGNTDWSDTAYLNDPKALALANEGDLKCIFQFDSEGIRTLAKSGGVTSFEDLVAYSAIYRPGPLGMKMHERYIERKRGREPYPMHPSIAPFMAKTYNVLAYQEQVMQMLHVVGGIPLKDCEIVRKAISKKDEKKFGKYKEMFLANGKRNLGVIDEEIADLWNQIAAFAEYGFNRSHACAYTVISSRLLWLKAHYPLEFFTAILSCEDVSEKIKEYKVEAHRAKVEVMPLDINISKADFDIHDGKVYFGISNVKGIGPEVAQRIVNGQPYKDFPDFLERYGTEANTIKPLLGLRAFPGDPARLYLYAEYYKDARKKKDDRKKRYEASLTRYAEELKALVPEEAYADVIKNGFPAEFDAKSYAEQIFPDMDVLKEIVKLQKKWLRSINTYARKEEAAEIGPTPYNEWNPDSSDWESLPPELERTLCDKDTAEREFYGFLWTHPLEKSPDYRGGHTFEAFRMDMEKMVTPEIQDSDWGFTQMVELEVKSVESKKSKNGNAYMFLRVEDANSEQGSVIVWSEDFKRFEPELKEGNLLKVRLKPPDPPFKTYTFASPPRHKRWLVPKSKDEDCRLVVMKKAPPEIMPIRERPVKDATPEEIMNELLKLDSMTPETYDD